MYRGQFLGLTFLNGAFLVAALAALLPIVIHLISRRRVETIDFSSLRFLKELERKRIRRVRLRQILLLIIRSLILLAAALALARPTLRGPLAGRGGGRARTSVAIVLDESASMSREFDGGALFDEAISAGHRIADLLDEGDQAFLVAVGDPSSTATPDGTFSRNALREALAERRVTASATDYVGAIAMARELLSSARNLNREVFVVGDLQRSGWAGARRGVASSADAGAAEGGAAADPGSAEPRGSEQEPRPADAGTASNDGNGSAIDGTTRGDGPGRADGPSIRGYLLPVEGPASNLGVVSADVSRKYGGTAGLFSITAEIRNWGWRAAEVPVRLFLDDVQIGQSGLALMPGESAVARFATVVDESEWHAGRVEIPDDVLAVDNQHYFAIPAARQTEVLVVGEAADEPGDDAYYVERALDPTGAAERFEPVVVEVPSLARQEHGRFSVVVLADVGRLDGSGERWIARHVADGGGVLLIFGDRTDMRYWNENLLPTLAGASFRTLIDRADGVRVAPASAGHPILEGLVFGERLVDDVSVRRGFTIEAADVEEVLELPGLGPLLTLHGQEDRGDGSGPGEVAALFTGVDPAWSDLPRSGFLVPLLHRLVRRLEGERARQASTIVGGTLVVPVEDGVVGRIEVALPDGGTALADRSGEGGGEARLTLVERPGVYRFASAGREIALGVANVEPRESDLEPATAAEIAELVPEVDFRVVDPDAPLEAEVLEARRGRELWRVFVYIALGLIALEMLLARPRPV